jgi:signal transduction histidine kinase
MFAARGMDGGAYTTPEPDICRALDKVAASSWRQGLLSIALVVGMGAAAYAAQGYAWLGLFGALLIPLAAANLALLVDRYLQARRPSWVRLWILLLTSIAAAGWMAPQAYMQWIAAHQLYGYSSLQVAAAATGLAILVIAAPLWRSQHDARALHLAQLKQAALAAELKALQAQIEPHFLYNTLANTRYLIRHDAGKAVHMLDHLIAYLHSALPNMRCRMSTVEQEFDMARHFLALMTIRFGDRVHYELHCSAEAARAVMPPLMLLSLVENAIKHGVEPQPGIVQVTLSATVENGHLCIAVRDTGAGIRTGVLGTGVGLRNLRERLSALYEDRGGFQLHSLDTGGTEAKLTIPLEMSE